MKTKLGSLMAAAVAAGAVLLSGLGDAYARRLCVKWQIRTEDSGTPVLHGPNAGDTEDKYATADGGALASALGVRIRISRTGWAKTYDTEPSTGCVTWSGDDDGYGGPYVVRVFGHQTDANNNSIRIHHGSNGGCWSDIDTRRTTKSIFYVDYTPSGGTDRIEVGNEGADWTTQAMMGYSLYRYHDDVHNKAMHVAFDRSTSCGSSAHYSSSNDFITEGRHCVRISDCATDDDRRWKFIVGHEFGHALAALHYGDRSAAEDGGEKEVDRDWIGLTDHSRCEANKYTIDSVEWNSLGFREGMAHFIASRVFNDRVLDSSTSRYEGAFNWQGGGSNPKTQDLQRPNYGAMAASENFYEDFCCASFGGTCLSNSGTIGDWHRFFWDFYTNQGFFGFCTTQPTKKNMLWLYSRTRLQPNPSKSNYFEKMRTAAQQMNLPSCLETTMFDMHAGNNGIDN